MPTGFVKWFNETKGYGFIQPDDGGPDAFVHISALERSGMHTLRENQRLSYDLEEDQRRGKTSAVNLRDAGEVDQSSEPDDSASASGSDDASA
jgi:CspA family cold shock protein